MSDGDPFFSSSMAAQKRVKISNITAPRALTVINRTLSRRLLDLSALLLLVFPSQGATLLYNLAGKSKHRAFVG